MERGTIVLSRFPFTDLSSTKRRPCVVVSKVDNQKPDVIVAFISSVIPSQIEATDLVIKSTEPDFQETGLHKDSVFKMDKLATLEKSIFSGELGNVSEGIMQKIEERLIIALDLNENQ